MQPLDGEEAEEALDETMAKGLEELGQHRAAAYFKTRKQYEELLKNQQNLKTHYFDLGDWVKIKNHARAKFEFRWKGPYIIANLGPPGVYYLKDMNGNDLQSPWNQSNMAPWLANTKDNQNFYYDGTQKNFFNDENTIIVTNPFAPSNSSNSTDSEVESELSEENENQLENFKVNAIFERGVVLESDLSYWSDSNYDCSSRTF
jgi:hypothetical protein